MKWKGSTSVGYWVNYATLTFDLTHDLDLGFFKVKFRISCISGIVSLIDMKRKESESDSGLTSWPYALTTPVTLTLKLQMSKFVIALSQEWEGWLIWCRRDACRAFMTMTLIFVWLRWGGWMYWIVTRLTSDVEVLLTYQVFFSSKFEGPF